MEKRKLDEACLDCHHSQEPEGDNYCYMFEKAPEILPCGQHDKYAALRKANGDLLVKHPVLFMMFIRGMGCKL